ncbi:uncharacterized protein BDR25DRAFT_356428 [Lindgomyces ingoldianus]|uniref:Uncharacterized protein n=1 Tax=Lindgomyces ingoldianus TaxID=673940 RepID=A0ACB6QSZ1_9PLEO|nr:uncharacterized protein BDR25DRAFT_356428 [Lindgomyces ingoldianus]KAF2469688.1 hypothetical protein BDR25DRAFT_356428 [Lindgomyces ingoldianus]
MVLTLRCHERTCYGVINHRLAGRSYLSSLIEAVGHRLEALENCYHALLGFSTIHLIQNSISPQNPICTELSHSPSGISLQGLLGFYRLFGGLSTVKESGPAKRLLASIPVCRLTKEIQFKNWTGQIFYAKFQIQMTILFNQVRIRVAYLKRAALIPKEMSPNEGWEIEGLLPTLAKFSSFEHAFAASFHLQRR